MPSPKQSFNQENKKVIPAWKPDPWNDRSEEFYLKVYAGGSCRYCGKQINTPLDICDCQGMKAARARFQALVRGNPQAPAKPIDYNPDKFLGEQEQIFEGEL